MALALIAIVGFLCYSNTFNGSFLYDDRSITESNSIKDISDLGSIKNLPVRRFVTFLSFAVNYHLVPLFAALLFVAHPVQTQAVTYISQRAASLATFFYLLSMVLYLKAAANGFEINRIRIFYFSLSLVAAIFAMFTKEIAFTLPLAITLIEFYFLNASWQKFKTRGYFLLIFLIVIL